MLDAEQSKELIVFFYAIFFIILIIENQILLYNIPFI